MLPSIIPRAAQTPLPALGGAVQRNDYLGWIDRAKRPATRHKLIQQMLEELRNGGVYMNMKHAPSKKP